MKSYSLVNKNATVEAQKLFQYLTDCYSNHFMLSGQQEYPKRTTTEWEMNYVLEKTGKLPAIRGLDFMHADFRGVINRAIDWYMRGGIVTICWHTGVNGGAYEDSISEKPDFDKLLTMGTKENELMLKNWDLGAESLKILQSEHVPVIWRPFHEFDGQWFWWGKGGAERFIELWRMMYDRYTNYHGLNNLIWVLGYSGEVKPGWYPGDEYCDIVGSDTYDGTTNKFGWDRLLKVCDKPLCYHEIGNLPHFDDFVREGTNWLWFMNWHTKYLSDNNSDILSEIYNNSSVITLDKCSKQLYN